MGKKIFGLCEVIDMPTFLQKVQKFFNSHVRVAAGSQVFDDGDPRAPKTPWGPAQEIVQVVPGVVWVYTAGHGGLRVSPAVARKKLTPAAIKLADKWGGSLWYEEDEAYAIPLYENYQWGVILNQLTGGQRVSQEQLGDMVRSRFPNYFKMVGEGYQLPAVPKVGGHLRVLKDIPYGSGRIVPAGEIVEIVEVKRSRLVFRYAQKRWSLSFEWMDRGYAEVV